MWVSSCPCCVLQLNGKQWSLQRCRWHAPSWVAFSWLWEGDFVYTSLPTSRDLDIITILWWELDVCLCQPDSPSYGCTVVSPQVLCQPRCHTSAAGAVVLLPLLLPLHASFWQELYTGNTECISSRNLGRSCIVLASPREKGQLGHSIPSAALCHRWMVCCSLQPAHMILCRRQEDSRSKGLCTPKPFWCLGLKWLQILRCLAKL